MFLLSFVSSELSCMLCSIQSLKQLQWNRLGKLFSYSHKVLLPSSVPAPAGSSVGLSHEVKVYRFLENLLKHDTVFFNCDKNISFYLSPYRCPCHVILLLTIVPRRLFDLCTVYINKYSVRQSCPSQLVCTDMKSRSHEVNNTLSNEVIK